MRASDRGAPRLRLITQPIEARREISLEPSPNNLMVQRQGGADFLDSVTLVGKQDDSRPKMTIQ
jgi:hypothetical protein